VSRLRGVVEGLVPWVVAVLTALAFTAMAPGRGLQFRSSSAYAGYKTEGWSGTLLGGGVFFHTEKEKQPWVEITLPAPTSISRVTVHNRRDNPKRGLPLVLELKEPDGTFRVLGTHKKSYRKHTFVFEPVVASTLRLRVDAKKASFLHLERVDVD
jgi:hypothetical protein